MGFQQMQRAFSGCRWASGECSGLLAYVGGLPGDVDGFSWDEMIEKILRVMMLNHTAFVFRRPYRGTIVCYGGTQYRWLTRTGSVTIKKDPIRPGRGGGYVVAC